MATDSSPESGLRVYVCVHVYVSVPMCVCVCACVSVCACVCESNRVIFQSQRTRMLWEESLGMNITRVGQNHKYTVYDRVWGEFPAKNTVYTPYIYNSGQPWL